MVEGLEVRVVLVLLKEVEDVDVGSDVVPLAVVEAATVLNDMLDVIELMMPVERELPVVAPDE